MTDIQASAETERLDAFDRIIVSAMAWQPSENGPSFGQKHSELMARASDLLAQPQTPACTHPDAKVWMYRDDDTWMICPDCNSKWVQEPIQSSQLSRPSRGPTETEDNRGGLGIGRAPWPEGFPND